METATAPTALQEGVEIASKYRLGTRLAVAGRQSDYETIYRGTTARIRLFRCKSAIEADELASGFALAFRLPHPNLLAVYDFGLDALDGENLAWIAMERGDECLGDIVAYRKLDKEEANELLAGLRPPLDFLRERGLGHAALCASNIFACGDQLKLSSDRISASALETGDEQMARLLQEVLGSQPASVAPETPPASLEGEPRHQLKYRKYAGLAIGGTLAAAALCALLVRGAHQTAITAAAPPTVEVVSAPAVVSKAASQSHPRITKGWAVAAASFPQAADAEKRARELLTAHPKLDVKIYSTDDSGHSFVLAYASGLTEAQAKKQLVRVRRGGAPRGTALRRFE